MKRIFEYCACVVVAVVTTTAVNTWVNASAKPSAQRAASANLALRAAIDSAIESKFTPIVPCRVVDTRVAGGKLIPGTPRGFVAANTAGFPAQGGTINGCGVPAAAT